MKSFKYLILLVLFGVLISCMNNSESSDEDTLSNQMIFKFGERMRKKYNTPLIGFGGAAKDGEGTTILAASFNAYRGPVQKDEARKMILDYLDEFLADINANEKLRPYLATYPFTAKNVDLEIYYSDPDGYEFYDPYIGVVSINEGIVYYRTYDKEDKTPFKSKTKETYEEALEIIRQDKPLKEDE